MFRRDLLRFSAAWAGLSWLSPPSWSVASDAGNWQLATFRADVSPPIGHPLCGGWIAPVVSQDDALEAIGLILYGAGDPVVLCAVDWTGLLNEAHLVWRQKLAEAVGTTADRVAVHCVHQHNAPFVCLEAQRLCAEQTQLADAVVDPTFFRESLDRVARAAQAAASRRRPVSHVATSSATVERVASNRRFLQADGKIGDWRGSSSKEVRHQALPEGLIDRQLKTVAFYEGTQRLAACHYYATHPMSYYGDGRVTSDFVGIARKRLQAEDADCTHLYFTGCAGNVAAGKYNDGSPAARLALTDRVYDGLRRSTDALEPAPLLQVAWQSQAVQPEPRSTLDEEALMAMVANPELSRAQRIRPAMMISWLRRCRQKLPIVLQAMHVNHATLIHLPAESFVEYQLAAQAAWPDRFVATAAYGDGGPWYIPTSECYPQGGYEVDVAFCEPTIDGLLRGGMREMGPDAG